MVVTLKWYVSCCSIPISRWEAPLLTHALANRYILTANLATLPSAVASYVNNQQEEDTWPHLATESQLWGDNRSRAGLHVAAAHAAAATKHKR
jgi:hypothetical protein